MNSQENTNVNFHKSNNDFSQNMKYISQENNVE